MTPHSFLSQGDNIISNTIKMGLDYPMFTKCDFELKII